MSDAEGPLVGWRVDTSHIAVPIDLTVYSLAAAMRAGYKLTDRCFVFIEREADNRAQIYLIGRLPTSDVATLAFELRNELLDQQLRCQLEEQFKDVRTLIVAQAFSEGNLIDSNADDGDYRSDPLGAGTHR